MAPDKEAIVLYGGNGTAHRYVMDPPLDLKIWLWEALAAGGRFWNCNFTGMHPNATHDRRNAFNNTEAYEFVREHEQLLTSHAPKSNIGIYYSRPTRQFYRETSPEGDHFDDAIKGVERVLTDNHIPYEFIADDQLSGERLSKYGCIILPNVRCMSDREIHIIREYVKNGGNLVATYATSLYDEHSVERKDFGLAKVFGCTFSGNRVNTRKDNYQFIAQPDHPIVDAMSKKTELLINAGFTLLCDPSENAKVICTHVPTVHNQPPEKAWVGQWSTEHPTMVEHSYEKGKVLYYANQPDRISNEFGHPDARQLLLNGILYLAGATIPVKTTAPASVHLGLTESVLNPGEYILSLVNTTSAPVRPVRELLPVFDIEVDLELKGMALKNSKILRSQGACNIRSDGDQIILDIEKLEDFFAVFLKVV
jgi:hypothetical protein